MSWGVARASYGPLPGSDDTNLLYLTSDAYSSMARYLGHSAAVLHCPEDTFLDAQQRAAGWPQRCRSVSMNWALGDGWTEVECRKHQSSLVDEVFLGFSTRTRSHFFVRVQDLVSLPPSMAWVFLDEHPDTINFPGFWTAWTPEGVWWGQLPASYHSRGCSLRLRRWARRIQEVGRPFDLRARHLRLVHSSAIKPRHPGLGLAGTPDPRAQRLSALMVCGAAMPASKWVSHYAEFSVMRRSTESSPVPAGKTHFPRSQLRIISPAAGSRKPPCSLMILPPMILLFLSNGSAGQVRT